MTPFWIKIDKCAALIDWDTDSIWYSKYIGSYVLVDMECGDYYFTSLCRHGYRDKSHFGILKTDCHIVDNVDLKLISGDLVHSKRHPEIFGFINRTGVDEYDIVVIDYGGTPLYEDKIKYDDILILDVDDHLILTELK